LRLSLLIQDESTNKVYTIIVTESLTPRHENTRRTGDVVPHILIKGWRCRCYCQALDVR